ncbi:unnamed protein product, partial [Prunus brigantina]
MSGINRCFIPQWFDEFNCWKLLQFLADNDDKVREVVMQNALGNLKSLPPCIQKEIVNSCALETLDAIMDGLKDKFFSILVDEACDVSVKEQMAMVWRYVDDKGHVIERFFGCSFFGLGVFCLVVIKVTGGAIYPGRGGGVDVSRDSNGCY